MGNIYYLSLSLLVLAILAHSAHGAPVNPIGTIGALSGLGWNSGILPVGRVSGRTSYQSELERTERGRGKRNDIEHVYSWWDNNGGLQVLDWVEEAPSVVLIGYVPFPEEGNWTAVVRGIYDNVHIKVGQKIAASRPNVVTVIRIAYEFNGEWMYWKADSNFIAGYKRIVDKIKQGAGTTVSNKIKFAWCMGGLSTGAGYTYQQLYPGDNYVDIVSIDMYDWPANFNQQQFNSRAGAELNTLLNFAKAHNKPYAIDEWGLHHVESNKNDGDDNPQFIQFMFSWIRENREWLAYEVYFQDDVPSNVDSSLFSANRNINPLSKAVYIQEMQRGTTSSSSSSSVSSSSSSTTKSSSSSSSSTSSKSSSSSTSSSSTSGSPSLSLVATVDEQVKTGTNKFVYTGASWTPCGACSPTTSYLNGFQYAYTTGDYVTITFSGRQAKIYAVKEKSGGIATYSVDGGAAVDVDNYASSSSIYLAYTSPILSSGTHTIKVSVSGRKNSASTSNTITVDKLEVFN